jgi:hypothetical protein
VASDDATNSPKGTGVSAKVRLPANSNRSVRYFTVHEPGGVGGEYNAKKTRREIGG